MHPCLTVFSKSSYFVTNSSKFQPVSCLVRSASQSPSLVLDLAITSVHLVLLGVQVLVFSDADSEKLAAKIIIIIPFNLQEAGSINEKEILANTSLMR